MPKIVGYFEINLQGVTPSLANNARRTIRSATTATFYNWQPVVNPYQIRVLSTSVQDSFALTTGLRAVKVIGVVQLADGSWNFWTETANMAGTTPVAIPITDPTIDVTGAAWVDVFYAEPAISGVNAITTGIPVGTISVQISTGAVTLLQIQPLENKSADFRFCLADGYRAVIEELVVGAITPNNAAGYVSFVNANVADYAGFATANFVETNRLAINTTTQQKINDPHFVCNIENKGLFEGRVVSNHANSVFQVSSKIKFIPN